MEKARISALLRSQRSLCGLTVDEVVERLKQFGIELSPKTLYGYENGVSMPNVPIFIALCDIYHVGNIIGAVSGDAPQKIPPAWRRLLEKMREPGPRCFRIRPPWFWTSRS